MAMSKKGLKAAILNKLTTKPLDSNGVTGATMVPTTQPDGSVKSEVVTTMGAIYMPTKMAEVISEAVAEAVIEHLTSSAETSSGDLIK